MQLLSALAYYGPSIFDIGGIVVILGVVLYLATIALVLWLGYLLMRTAVKNGMLLADAEIRRRDGRPPHDA